MNRQKASMLLMIIIITLTACEQRGPGIGDIEISGDLASGNIIAWYKNIINVSCSVSEKGRAEIISVTADLSSIGGPDNTTLERSDNGTWQWSGIVTPPEEGEMMITLTAKDSFARQGSTQAEVQVFAPSEYSPSNMIVPEIQEVKRHLDQLKEEGLVAEWELPYENILTRLTAAIFFLTPTDDSKLHEIWAELDAHPRLTYRLNEEKKLSQLEWRVEFNKGFELKETSNNSFSVTAAEAGVQCFQ